MAATPGIINASDFVLYVDGLPTAHSTNVNVALNVDMMDATNKDSEGWEESIPGKISWKGSGDFYYDQAVGSSKKGIVALFNAAVQKTIVAVVFRLKTQVVGDLSYSGSVYIESIDISAGVEENVSYSISFKGTGKLTRSALNP
jgi:predicted secreted protein